jgi:hypothetical protein
MLFPPGSPAAAMVPRQAEALLMIQVADHDQVIVDRQMEIMDGIALQQGGALLDIPPLEENPQMVARLAGIGLTCFCEIIYPILQAPALCRYVIDEFVPRYQEMMIRVPGTPLPYWNMLLTGITNHTRTDFTFVYGVDVSNKKTRQQAYQVYHELLDHIYCSGGGGAPHAMAKDMYTPHWRNYLKPEYGAFLKKLKEALDPAGILNPGSLFPG